jgi:hypothetical protein
VILLQNDANKSVGQKPVLKQESVNISNPNTAITIKQNVLHGGVSFQHATSTWDNFRSRNWFFREKIFLRFA